MDYIIEITQIEAGEIIPICTRFISEGWYCFIYYENGEERHFSCDSLRKITGKLNYWNRNGLL